MRKLADRAPRYDHQRIDDVIHSRIRLAIMSILVTVEDAEFTFLRDQVATTDGNLATHLGKLRAAGYIRQQKTSGAGRASTRLAVTAAGRQAFEAYLTQLEALLPRR